VGRTWSTWRLECLGGLGAGGGVAVRGVSWASFLLSWLVFLSLAASSLSALAALSDFWLPTNFLHKLIRCSSFWSRLSFLVGVPRLLRPFVPSDSTYGVSVGVSGSVSGSVSAGVSGSVSVSVSVIY